MTGAERDGVAAGMSAAVDPRMLAFVATQHAGVLATVKRDGHPQLSNLF